MHAVAAPLPGGQNWPAMHATWVATVAPNAQWYPAEHAPVEAVERAADAQNVPATHCSGAVSAVALQYVPRAHTENALRPVAALNVPAGAGIAAPAPAGQ